MRGKSYLPCPSSFHGRGPDTEHREPSRKAGYLAPGTRSRINTEDRRPSPATEKRAYGVCIMHTPCAGFSKAGTWYRVPGIGYRPSGTWDLVPGTGAESTPKSGHRAPKTEPGHRKTRTSGMHPVSCIHLARWVHVARHYPLSMESLGTFSKRESHGVDSWGLISCVFRAYHKDAGPKGLLPQGGIP